MKETLETIMNTEKDILIEKNSGTRMEHIQEF
jgi:hypothetical protein